MKSRINQKRLQRIRFLLERFIGEGNQLPGAQTLVWHRGELVDFHSAGFRDRENQLPIEEDTIFRIYSMTKPIISVAFMMLYEEGHFFLTDPVSKYLPGFDSLRVIRDPNDGVMGETDPIETPINMIHLLSHTAGFSHGLGGNQLEQDYNKAMYQREHGDIQSRMNAMLEMPLLGQPGEQWAYSGSPDVLSVLIEQFSGMSTADFIQQRIFDPLGMDDTGYNVADDDLERVVTLHFVDENGELKVAGYQPPNQGVTINSGVNGLWSTAQDYLTFSRMMLNEGESNGQRLLSRKTVELMTTNHVGDLFGDGGFGLGFGLVTDLAKNKASGSVGQFFWGGAFCTYFFIDPEEEMVAIMMTQLNPYSNYYSNKFRQFVYQAIAD